MRTFLSLMFLAIVAILLRMSLFTVDATEYAYVTQFGRHVATYDGSKDDDAGLHWRWPWPIQSVQRLDRRLQHFDLDGTELLTRDTEGKTIDKTLAVEAYVCWQIADKEAADSRDAVDRFIRRLGTSERARDILTKSINSLVGATISKKNLDELITTDRVGDKSKADVTMASIQQQLQQGLQRQFRSEYGIELVDVRLRRFNHPSEVRQSIFDRIISERSKKAASYRSEGEKQAKNITSAADEQVRDMLAKARFQEEKLKGEADTEAAMIRNQAHSKDPEFYVFLKKLDKLQSILGDSKTTLLLSSHREIFNFLFEPPRPGPAPGRPPVDGKAASANPSSKTLKQPVKGGG
jgi:membrane protease subunit HflC